jgi:hypothetical protein
MPYLKSGDESDDIETFYEVYRAGSTLPRPIIDPFTSCSHLDELEPAEELDRNKETVVLFPGCSAPCTIFMEQIRCEELRSNYNLVTLGRSHGEGSFLPPRSVKDDVPDTHSRSAVRRANSSKLQCKVGLLVCSGGSYQRRRLPTNQEVSPILHGQ